ncbi:hypothetical protein C1Y63_06565 [Corynebacterium sp. 13CS0277]|uniref:HtaA domain-containing protein n=1 Tax=Corynebacterium sp. 13CS0277 TaxID=2071994 RepID=UPI000D03AB1B|nr:HtaA domain-containing protein [Corynebacterium sp. 13CS0277]PRQ11365.1 hypothetical protein C1Y63_06565 [Corynebacterium sp. 13CS0277]
MTSRLTRTLAAASVLALAGAAAPQAFAADAATECSGTVSWKVTKSYVGYLTKRDDVKVETFDGVEVGDTITFPIDGEKTLAATKGGKMTIVTAGGYHATGHGGVMDTTVKNLRVDVDNNRTAGKVSIDFASKPRTGATTVGDMVEGSGEVVSLKFDKAFDDASAAAGVSAAATYVESAAKAALPYPAGKEMAPVEIKATGCGFGEAKGTSDNTGGGDGSSNGLLPILGVLAILGAVLAGAFQWAVSQGLLPAPR